MNRNVHWFYIALLTAVALPAYSADWPSWTGPHGTNSVSAENLPASFDRESLENVKWSVELGEVAFGAPTVAGGRVYIGTNMPAMRGDDRFRGVRGGVLACLDEATGERIWNLISPVRTEGFPRGTHMIQQRWGICSSPTVDGDRVYVVTNGNDLLCLDVAGLRNGNDGPFQDEAAFMSKEGAPPITLSDTDADIIWRYDISRELDVAPHDVASSSVLVHGDVLYIATSNGIGRGSPIYALKREAPGFIALNKHTGEYLARENESLSENLFHAQWGSATKAVVGDQTQVLLGGSDGYCYAFKPLDGAKSASGFLETLWKFDCNPPDYQRAPDGSRIFYYQGDHRVYKQKKDVGLSPVGFNSGDGTFKSPNEILASPVHYENRVYVATGRDPLHGFARRTLSCIDARKSGNISETGLLWQYRDIGRSLSTVAIADGLVYAADLEGRVYCLGADTGALYWKHDTGHEIWGNLLVADGKVYINTKDSLWIFRAGHDKEVLHTSRGGSECGAITANGVVYVFIRGELFALQSD